jgi:uncharacterized protein YjbI with pentapeptide repeats
MYLLETHNLLYNTTKPPPQFSSGYSFLVLSQSENIQTGIIIGPNVYIKNINLYQKDLSRISLSGVRSSGLTVQSSSNFDPETGSTSSLQLPQYFKLINGVLVGPSAILENCNFIGTNLSNLTTNNLRNIRTNKLLYDNTTTFPNGYKIIDGILIGPEVDLSDVDLSYMTITDIDVTKINFTGANLKYTITRNLLPTNVNQLNAPTFSSSYRLVNGCIIGAGVYLNNVILTESTVNSINYINPSLTADDLVNTKSQNITSVTLPNNYQLVNGYIVGPNVNLTNAKLNDTVATGLSLEGANLLGANLIGANWRNVNSDLNTKLSVDYSIVNNCLVGPYTDLSGITLSSNLNLSSKKLDGIKSGDVLTNGNPKELLPDGYILKEGYIIGPKVNLTNFDITGKSETFFDDLNLSGANLSGLDLSSFNLSNTKLIDANLSGVLLREFDNIHELVSDALSGDTSLASPYTASASSYLSSVDAGSEFSIETFKPWKAFNKIYHKTQDSYGWHSSIKVDGVLQPSYNPDGTAKTNIVRNQTIVGSETLYGEWIQIETSDSNNLFKNVGELVLYCQSGLNERYPLGISILGKTTSSSDWVKIYSSETSLGRDIEYPNSEDDGTTIIQLDNLEFDIQNAEYSHIRLIIHKIGLGGDYAEIVEIQYRTKIGLPIFNAEYKNIGNYFVGPNLLLKDFQLNNVNLSSCNLSGVKTINLGMSNIILPTNYIKSNDNDNILGPNMNLTNTNININTSLNLSGVITGGTTLESGSSLPSNYNLLEGGYIVGPNVNLTNFDITGKPSNYFNNQNLSGANMSGLDLRNFELSSTNLTNADLTDVKLPEGLTVTGDNATLFSSSYIKIGNFIFGTGLDLSEQNIYALDLSQLSSDTLINMTFRNTSIHTAPTGYIMINNNLVGPRLNLSDMDLSSSNLSNLSLYSCKMTRTILYNSTLENISSGNIKYNLHKPIFNNSYVLENGYIVGYKTNLVGMDFNKVNMQSVNLIGTKLINSDTNEKVLFSGSNNDGTILPKYASSKPLGTGVVETILPPDYELVNGFLVGPNITINNLTLSGQHINYNLTNTTITTNLSTPIFDSNLNVFDNIQSNNIKLEFYESSGERSDYYLDNSDEYETNRVFGNNDMFITLQATSEEKDYTEPLYTFYYNFSNYKLCINLENSNYKTKLYDSSNNLILTSVKSVNERLDLFNGTNENIYRTIVFYQTEIKIYNKIGVVEYSLNDTEFVSIMIKDKEHKITYLNNEYTLVNPPDENSNSYSENAYELLENDIMIEFKTNGNFLVRYPSYKVKSNYITKSKILFGSGFRFENVDFTHYDLRDCNFIGVSSSNLLPYNFIPTHTDSDLLKLPYGYSIVNGEFNGLGLTSSSGVFDGMLIQSNFLFPDNKYFYNTNSTVTFIVKELKQNFGNIEWEKTFYTFINEIKSSTLATRDEFLYKIIKQAVKQTKKLITTLILPVQVFEKTFEKLDKNGPAVTLSVNKVTFIDLPDEGNYKNISIGSDIIKIVRTSSAEYSIYKNEVLTVVKNKGEKFEYLSNSNNYLFNFFYHSMIVETFSITDNSVLIPSHKVGSSNIIVTISNNEYIFNSLPSSHFVMTEGVYTFTGITEDNPIAFIATFPDKIKITGTPFRNPVSTAQAVDSNNKYTNETFIGAYVQHYYGVITVEIIDDFGYLQYHNYFKGWYGGQYKKVFYEKTIFTDFNFNAICDLSNTTFLSNKDLTGSIFTSNIILGNTDLTNSILNNIDLSQQISISDVTLKNNITSNIITNNNSPVVYPILPIEFSFNSGYIMGPSMIISNITFTDFSFKNFNLQGTKFINCTFIRVKSGGVKYDAQTLLPTGYKLVGRLNDGYIIGSGVNLTDAVLTDCNLTNCSLDLVISSNVTKTNAVFPPLYDVVDGYIIGPNVVLTNASFSSSSGLVRKTLTNSNLTNVKFSGCDLTGCDFSNCNLTNVQSENLLPRDVIDEVSFSDGFSIRSGYIVGPGVKLDTITLSDCDLTDIDFSNVKSKNISVSNVEFKKNNAGDEIYKIINGYIVGPNIDISGLNFFSSSFYGLISGGIISDEHTVFPNDKYKNVNGYIIGEGVNLYGAVLSNLNMEEFDFTNVRSGSITYISTNLFNTSYYILSGYLLGPNVDLSNSNFNGINFSNKDLTNSNFTGCSFKNVDISNTNFSECSFKNIVSENVYYITNSTHVLPDDFSVEDGILIGPYANLSDKIISCSLAGKNLINANLTNAIFNGVNVDDLNLTDAILENFKSTNIIEGVSGATFTNLNGPLYKVINGYIVGKNVNLSNCDLSYCDLSTVKIDHIKTGNTLHSSTILPSGYEFISNGYLVGPNLDISNYNLVNEDLRTVDFTGIRSKNIKYELISKPVLPSGYVLTNDGCILGPNINLDGVNLFDCDLTLMNYANIKLQNVIHDHTTILKDKYFITSKNYLLGPDVDMSNLKLSFGKEIIGKNLRFMNLSNCELTDTVLTNTDLRGANLSGLKSKNIHCKQPDLLPYGYTIEEGVIIGTNVDLTEKSFYNLNVFAGKNLENANLSRMNLSGYDLTGTNLSNAVLFGIKSGNIKCSGSCSLPPNYTLTNGYIVGPDVILENAIFNNVVINHNVNGIYSKNVSGISFQNTDFKLVNGHIIGPYVNLFGYNLENADLTNCVLTNCYTTGIIYNALTIPPSGYEIKGDYNNGVIIGHSVIIILYVFNSQTVIEDINLSSTILYGVSGPVTFENTNYFLVNGNLFGPNTVITDLTIKAEASNLNMFNNKDLSGISFNNVTFDGFDLSGTNLSNMSITNCVFKNITFTEINPPAFTNGYSIVEGYLVGRNVNLVNVTFSNKNALKGKDLTGTNLSNNVFIDFDFSGTIFTNVAFTKTKSSGIISDNSTIFSSGRKIVDGVIVGPYVVIENKEFLQGDNDLSQLNLEGISTKNVSNVILPTGFKLINGVIIGPHTTLKELNLYNTNLADCNLSNVSSENLKFSSVTNQPLLPDGYKIVGKNGYGSIIGINVDISDMNFKYTNMLGVNSNIANSLVGNTDEGIHLTGVTFNDLTILPDNSAIINGIYFGPRVSLTNVILKNINLSNIDLTFATITNATVTNVTLKDGYKFIGNDLTKQFLIGPSIDLSGTVFDYYELVDLDLSNSIFTGCSFVKTIGYNLHYSVKPILPLYYDIVDGYLLGPDIVQKGISLKNNSDLSNVRFTNSQIYLNSHLNITLHSDYKLFGKYIIGTGIILDSANLSGLDLSTANFYHVTVSNIISDETTVFPSYTYNGTLTYYKPSGGYIFGPNIIISNINMAYLDLSDINLDGTILRNVKSGVVTYTNSTILPTGYAATRLTTEYLSTDTELANPIYTGIFIGPNMILSNIDLSNHNLTNVDFRNSTFINIKSGGIIGTPMLPTNCFLTANGYIVGNGAILTNADFSGQDLTNFILDGLDLSTCTIDKFTILPDGTKYYQDSVNKYNFIFKEFESEAIVREFITYLENIQDTVLSKQYIHNVKKMYFQKFVFDFDMNKDVYTVESNPFVEFQNPKVTVYKGNVKKVYIDKYSSNSIYLDSNDEGVYTIALEYNDAGIDYLSLVIIQNGFDTYDLYKRYNDVDTFIATKHKGENYYFAGIKLTFGSIEINMILSTVTISGPINTYSNCIQTYTITTTDVVEETPLKVYLNDGAAKNYIAEIPIGQTQTEIYVDIYPDAIKPSLFGPTFRLTTYDIKGVYNYDTIGYIDTSVIDLDSFENMFKLETLTYVVEVGQNINYKLSTLIHTPIPLKIYLSNSTFITMNIGEIETFFTVQATTIGLYGLTIDHIEQLDYFIPDYTQNITRIVNNVYVYLSSTNVSKVGDNVFYTVSVVGGVPSYPIVVTLTNGVVITLVDSNDVTVSSNITIQNIGNLSVNISSVTSQNEFDNFVTTSMPLTFTIAPRNDVVIGKGGGDPYIITMENGECYKLPSKIRHYRLFESPDIIINATVAPMKPKYIQAILDMFNDNPSTFIPKTTGFYFENFYVSIKNTFFVFDEDINLLNTNYNNTNCTLTVSNKPLHDYIDGLSSAYFPTVITYTDSLLGKVEITLKKDVNPQIVNGISCQIERHSLLKNLKGVLVRRSNTRNYEIKKLDSLKPVANTYATSVNYKVSKEKWYNKNVVGMKIV